MYKFVKFCVDNLDDTLDLVGEMLNLLYAIRLLPYRQTCRFVWPWRRYALY